MKRVDPTVVRAARLAPVHGAKGPRPSPGGCRRRGQPRGLTAALGALAAGVCLAGFGCSDAAADAPTEGPRLVVTETLGDPASGGARVTLRAALVRTNGVLEVEGVAVKAEPAAEGAARKLESLVEDVALSPPGDDWAMPAPSRTVAVDARPEASRLVAALALWSAPDGVTGEHASVRLGDGAFGVGAMRVSRRGATLRLEAVSAGADEAISAVSWTVLEGPAEPVDGRLRLQGERVVASGESQTRTPVVLEVAGPALGPFARPSG